MRKWLLFCLAVFCTLLLSACSRTAAYSAEIDGREYWIDTDSQTISDGLNTYTYTFSGTKDRYTMEITFPDGSSYWWSQSDGSGHGGWQDELAGGYQNVDGSALCDAVVMGLPDPPNYALIVFAVILLAIGVFNIVRPQTAWFWSSGWKYKNVEPSDYALVVYRIGGGVVAIIAVFLFLQAFA